MFKRTFPFVIAMIAGLAMIALSTLYKSESQKLISALLIGVGAGLFGMSTANLIMKRYQKKNPSLVRQSEIEYKDERNTIIRDKARAVAGNIIRWFFIAVAFVCMIIDAPLWTTLSAVGVFLLFDVLTLIFMSHYKKQM